MKMMTDQLNEKFEELKEALQSNQKEKTTGHRRSSFLLLFIIKGKGTQKLYKRSGVNKSSKKNRATS